MQDFHKKASDPSDSTGLSFAQKKKDDVKVDLLDQDKGKETLTIVQDFHKKPA